VWLTILRKREAYGRRSTVSTRIGSPATRRLASRALLGNAGIVRNRAKIESAIANRAARSSPSGGSSAASTLYLEFCRGTTRRNARRRLADIPAKTPLAEAMSGSSSSALHLRRTTICYAFMQACGLVNDHLVDCFRYMRSDPVSAG